jgi:hypothetical protein
MSGEQINGHVMEVVKWTGIQSGFTYRVKYDNGDTGENRSDDTCLFKEGDEALKNRPSGTEAPKKTKKRPLSADGGQAPKKSRKKRMLILQVGDRTIYVNDSGHLIHGQVSSVVKWTRGTEGFTYYVKHDYGGIGEFRSTDKCLFKEGDDIPREVYDKCAGALLDKRLRLKVGDGIIYITIHGMLAHGTVDKVVKWEGSKEGYTYYATYEDGAPGQFEWDHKYVFKK